MAALEKLLAAEGASAASPASPAQIEEVTKLFKSGLPPELVNLWRAANGITFDAMDAGILSCEQVVDFIRKAPALGLVHREFLPLIDDHQSNYLALALGEPLAHRIVDLPHDDGPRLLFNGLESCLEALIACLDAGETLDCFVHEAAGDYAPEARRSERDQQAARLLMATDGEASEWNFATQLLDESNLDEFAQLLETDHFVRRDVRARMESMQALEIRKLLGQDRKTFAEFKAAVTAAAQSAGMKVEKASSDDVLRIGGKYISLEAFFYLRHEPDAMPRMMARLRQMI